MLDEVQEILEQASWKAGEEEKQQQLQTAAESLSQSLASSEPPQCKGQQHHLISRRIAKGLSRHPTLKGLYEPRDSRLVSRAKDEQSHCGYQEWHRNVDEEVVNWLEQFPQATPKQFMDKLREIYGRPEMKARFPNGF